MVGEANTGNEKPNMHIPSKTMGNPLIAMIHHIEFVWMRFQPFVKTKMSNYVVCFRRNGLICLNRC
ncbi:hypothetical protein A6M23_07620 [Acidithiobacillus thiooxidans]|uniref:Uncharacterized protein n=1 Tax=Acidithiobacillus thiooxidans TaxID=930 RepID=A0A1C2ICU2_ACITH|nr:hypothetical protein A6M23_07620 [Acidithiobacillus thiooxidans]OCX86337.1 hypothetical protein A6P08_06290 [Acidithiobacillus thiooxidans]